MTRKKLEERFEKMADAWDAAGDDWNADVFQQGVDAGRKWATNDATRSQLRRFCGIHDDGTVGAVIVTTDPGLNAAHQLAELAEGRQLNGAEVLDFWQSAVGEEDDRTDFYFENEDAVQGFVAGVLSASGEALEQFPE